LLTLLSASGLSQTYQVGPDTSAKPTAQNDQAPSAGQQLGFGSNIQNARLARAAELALQRGDHALAYSYAQRAAQAAPNDPQLWLLLGYSARLDGKYGPSAEAYQHGLRLKQSVEGLSGLAQTYSLSGRTDEAERLLKQVIAADPNRRNDLSALGEIYMRSGNYNGALEWLGRAERIEPAAQSELLLAVAYEHLKQMDLASHYLELAKSKAPNNPDIERSLAAFFRDTGDFDKAIAALNSIRNPKPDIVAELAFTYGLGGKMEDSARVYIQAANLLPHDLNLQLSAAQAQVSIASMDKADLFLQRAARIDPTSYRLHAIRGEIAQIQDRDSDAAQEFSIAVSNVPASPPEGPLYGIQLRMNLVALYSALDQPDLSHQQLEIAQTKIEALDERGSDRAAFLRLRALIRMDGGQLAAALTDMTESLAINSHDPNSLQLDGDLLMKMGRTSDAIVEFKKVLDIDPHSRFALTSLGYASRASGNDADAEKYFNLLAQNYPNSYVPFLALGDLYTARHDFAKAQTAYATGYARAPKVSLIVAGGMGAAIESHDLTLAGEWQRRVTEKMAMVPQVLREEERYFSFTGDNKKSAELGHEAIKLMPRDRDVVIYLGYDLLHLEQWEDLQALTAQYKDLFPKEPDIPLLAGYVYKHDGQLDEAVANFTEALNRDPNVVTAYTNRGFVLNDLHQPAKAAADFEESLKREPNNIEAHMGLAFADLNLHHWQAAIHQTQLAEKIAGDSELVHTIRATAYGGEGLLTKSAAEYTAALKFDPTDGSLYLGLGNIYFAQRRYRDAVVQLESAVKYLPENARIYALMARANANLQNREETLRDVQLAEEYAGRAPQTPTTAGSTNLEHSRKLLDSEDNGIGDIYVSTGEALSTLGDQTGAMDRFSKALLAPRSNRVSVRLAIAQLMAQQDHTADAERQIALAEMEVVAGDTLPPTGEQYIQAANTLQLLHEYELSETYLERAKAAGAPDSNVRIALANSLLALGETRRAAAELAAVKQTDDGELDYQYLLAEASLYQQQHQSTQALTSFAAAATDAGEDPTAEQGLLQAGADEGFRVTPKLSVLSNLIVQPIFEDSTVYVLDSKLNSPNGPVPVTDTALLPPPRSSIETDWINSFHLHLNHLPANGGFFQIRNAQGDISVPATSTIQQRNTTDYSLNFGLDPTVHLGTNVVTFNSGIQGTIRRDSLSPIELNQNLFRVFTYVTTSSFFNAISMDGFVAAEFGPFTETAIDEHAYTGAIDFRVGAPWSKTALVTGWGANNQRFNSSVLGNSQNYYTTSYIGLTHRFSTRLSSEVIVEDLRAFRVVPFSPIHSAISQALRPAATIDFAPNHRWDIQASTSYENTRGFHIYDMTQNGIALSYTRPLERTFNDSTGKIRLKYPIKFSGGIREETFTNFNHGPAQQFRPYVSITIF
jgi:tetratricopeptide (TPR) repeat protein